MHRIGIAASKIAKGKLLWYNLYVIVISFLFSLIIFAIGGSAIVIGIVLIIGLFQTKGNVVANILTFPPLEKGLILTTSNAFNEEKVNNMLLHGMMPANIEKQWISILVICMITLAFMTGLVCLIGISRNLKLKR